MLTIKTSERHQRRRSVFVVNFEHKSVFSSPSIVGFEQVNVSCETNVPIR